MISDSYIWNLLNFHHPVPQYYIDSVGQQEKVKHLAIWGSTIYSDPK